MSELSPQAETRDMELVPTMQLLVVLAKKDAVKCRQEPIDFQRVWEIWSKCREALSIL